MNTIQKFDTIHQYNELLGQETLHPLVNVIDLAQSCRLRHGLHSFGFYTVFLKEIKCGNLRYGCNYYDYQEGHLFFLLRDRSSVSKTTVSLSTAGDGPGLSPGSFTGNHSRPYDQRLYLFFVSGERSPSFFPSKSVISSSTVSVISKKNCITP